MNDLLEQLAEALLPVLEKRQTLKKSGILKSDSTTWPPKLHKVWEKCAEECSQPAVINPLVIDTGSSVDETD